MALPVDPGHIRDCHERWARCYERPSAVAPARTAVV